MKIWTQGCREEYCQLPRIETAFESLGHQITTNAFEADLIYVNNAWYDFIQSNYADLLGVIVLNVLDLAPHIKTFPLDKLKQQLRYADFITTISQTVKNDLLARTGLSSTVIYQPIQPIARLPVKKHPFKFMFCGRVGDPNKRVMLGVEALRILGVKPSEVISTGTEFMGYGYYAGLIAGQQLNELYNSVDYVIFPSKEEGIGLPAIEAVAAGAIPVLCDDLSTLKEFFPFPEYDQVCASPQCIAQFISFFEDNPDRKQAFREKLYQHYKDNLEDKFSGVGVATRILKTVTPFIESNIKIARV